MNEKVIRAGKICLAATLSVTMSFSLIPALSVHANDQIIDVQASLDHTALDTILAKAKEAIENKDLYSDNGWDVFEKAYNAAFMVKEDVSATQEDVDLATKALVDAYLELRKDPTSVVELDITVSTELTDHNTVLVSLSSKELLSSPSASPNDSVSADEWTYIYDNGNYVYRKEYSSNGSYKVTCKDNYGTTKDVSFKITEIDEPVLEGQSKVIGITDNGSEVTVELDRPIIKSNSANWTYFEEGGHHYLKTTVAPEGEYYEILHTLDSDDIVTYHSIYRPEGGQLKLLVEYRKSDGTVERPQVQLQVDDKTYVGYSTETVTINETLTKTPKVTAVGYDLTELSYLLKQSGTSRQYATITGDHTRAELELINPSTGLPQSGTYGFVVKSFGTGAQNVSTFKIQYVFVDRSELDAMIAQAQGLKEEDYTSETWNDLKQKLAEAQAVSESNTSTQTEVNKALDALNTAMENLEEKVSITSVSLGSLDKGYLYVKEGESYQLEVVDQDGNPIDASLLDFKLNNTKELISVDDNGLIHGLKKADATGTYTQVTVSLKSDSNISAWVNVVVPTSPVINSLKVATGATSKPMEDYTGGAISDTGSKTYYFYLSGNAEWNTKDNGLPEISWYLDDELVKTTNFNRYKDNDPSLGIKDPDEVAIKIETYGKHTVKAVLKGADGQTTEKVMEVERTPIWLNTDGSIKKITENAGDVVIPSIINGKTITTLGTITKASLLATTNSGVLPGVTSVTIPDTVTTISSDFFVNATDLETIVFTGNVPQGNLDLSNTKIKEEGILVPEEYKDDFKEAVLDWKAPEGIESSDLIEKPLTVEEITYSNNNGNTVTKEDVTVTITTSKAIADVEGWNRVSDRVISKTYSENGKYEVTIADISGNELVVKFEVKRIDKINPVINLQGVEPDGWTREDVTYTIKEQSIKAIIIDGKEYDEKSAPATITGIGKHTIQVIDKAGNQASVTFEIVESTKPTITIKDTSIGSDGYYSRLDLKLYDASKVDYVLINGKKKDLVDNAWSDLNSKDAGYQQGENEVILVDVYGNETSMTFIYDTQAPVISASDLTIEMKSSFDPMKGVSAVDNGETLAVEVVSNTVNTSKKGDYQVTYKATDKAGNTAEKTITVTVVKKQSTIDKIIKETIKIVDKVVKAFEKIFGWLF